MCGYDMDNRSLCGLEKCISFSPIQILAVLCDDETEVWTKFVALVKVLNVWVRCAQDNVCQISRLGLIQSGLVLFGPMSCSLVWSRVLGLVWCTLVVWCCLVLCCLVLSFVDWSGVVLCWLVWCCLVLCCLFSGAVLFCLLVHCLVW